MREVMVFFAFISLTAGQAPTGTIAGVVGDPVGALVSRAQVSAVSVQTSLSRSVVTSDVGGFTFSALAAGEYSVEVKAAGFQTVVRPVTVETGMTTTSDFTLEVGEIAQSVTVDGAGPQIRYDAYTIGGSISRSQIDNIPTNGRNFLELAKSEPGVQPPTTGFGNQRFVSSLGAPGGNSGRGTRVTIDGGSIMVVGPGGSAMGFSQEAVQEFQVSTVNFDLSTGSTVSGAINAVTRSGSNVFHGTAFWFFRDHSLAAYPALRRDKTNPDPFFQRRQFGLALGGPIRPNRMFFFGNWERNEQRGVVAATLVDPDFSHFSRITASPLFGNQINLRLDGRISNAHTAFVRYSHDGVRAFEPTGMEIRQNAYPSNWPRRNGWSDQSLLGVTSAFSTVVNDFRFSYFFNSAKQLPAGEHDCSGCLGISAPTIRVSGSGLTIGGSSVNLITGRRFHLNDFVTWQLDTHRLHLGVDWEHNRRGQLAWADEPATITLYSPSQARQAGIPSPLEFNTLSDILALPLRSARVGVGDAGVPQADGSLARHWDTIRLFFQDTWRLSPRVVVNYGLGWSIDRNLNYDLSKPKFLAPILGENSLGPTRKQWKNFAPALGLVWKPSANSETVFRAGSGLFYDFLFQGAGLDVERSALGPPGTGRQTSEPLDFRTATPFTGADLMAMLPAIRASLAENIQNANRSVQQIEISKTLPPELGVGLNGRGVPRSSALHVNIGVQRRITRDLVLSADLAYRRFNHVAIGGFDANHFSSVNGAAIRACAPFEKDDPQALCSNGPISMIAWAGRATYKGLLVRAEKRLSNGLQFLGSWAYSRNIGTSDSFANGFNLHNWLENRGPLPTDFTHILNLSGVGRMHQFDLGFNFFYSSPPPFSAYVGGVDFNGDGTTGDLLPGSTVNAFNRGMGAADLARLVDRFNQTYAGKTDAVNARIPALTLPREYGFGDNFHSLDVRLSRSFTFHDRGRLTLTGDVFNVYNAANLSGQAGDLTNTATFGQPTARSSQVFGSGGPRAFQLAVKVSF